MPKDQMLSEADIPATVARKLEDLDIRSVRQLYSRLRGGGRILQDYLQLSNEDFDEFSRKVEGLVKEEYPEDTLPRLRPTVNKRGVAAHRLDDPTRPRYDKRREE